MKKKVIGLIDGQSGNIGSINKAIKESGKKFAKLFQEEKKSWELWLEKDSLDGKQTC